MNAKNDKMMLLEDFTDEQVYEGHKLARKIGDAIDELGKDVDAALLNLAVAMHCANHTSSMARHAGLLGPVGALVVHSNLVALHNRRIEVADKHEPPRYLLVHPEMGIYLGNCMGLGFWTKLDPAGQADAITFATESEAREHIKSWDEGPTKHEQFAFVPIRIQKRYATISECVAVGLDPWDPNAKPAEKSDGGAPEVKKAFGVVPPPQVGGDVQVNTFKPGKA